MKYLTAVSKSEATARMYALAGRDVEPLGPGSKEKRSALEALGAFLGIDLSGVHGKSECGRVLATHLGVSWDADCHSAGDTITLTGLNRLLDAAVAQIEDPSEHVAVVDAFATLPPAQRADRIDEETQRVPDVTELQHDIAERIAALSEPSETPQGMSGSPQRIEISDVRFDNGDWRGRVAAIQGWLQLPQELDVSSPEAFDASLADGLGVATSAAGGSSDESMGEILARLADRLDRAVALRESFLDAMEAAAEGGATLESATIAWAAEWEEVVDEEESETGGPIQAIADTWPISDFAQYASDNELNLSPSYQRADVWDTGKAQMLIESVIRGIPLPSIIILKQQDPESGVVNYEVVDGKQRLTSILRFIGRHPRALQLVRAKADQWDVPDLEKTFRDDYRAFKKLWKKNETSTLSAQLERELYFPFPLRSGDVKSLSGDLAVLRGQYYSDIQKTPVNVVGDVRPLRAVFETTSKYKIPVIVYEKVTTEQVHEVFSLYNKQGKHLNAEEIRNALYHRLDFMRALLATAGDTEDLAVVAPFLVEYWDDLSSTPEVLDGYGFGKAGYKRTKLLSWVASVLFFDDGRPDGRSTASQINALLKRIASSSTDPLRDKSRVAEAMRLLDHGLDAHASIPPEVWAPTFRNSQKQGKWQELQLVAALIGFSAAYQVLGDDLDDVVEGAMPQLSDASAGWKRPTKTQSKEQWAFIAGVVRDLLGALQVPVSEADAAIRSSYGFSGLQTLVDIVEQ
ncbi:MAG: DUF262 domain-containing protein [Microbacteriaceae bacterium]